MNILQVLSGAVSYVLYGNGVGDPNYDRMMDAAYVARQEATMYDGTSITSDSDAWTVGAPLSGVTVDRPASAHGFWAFSLAIIACLVVGAVNLLLTPLDHFPFELPTQVKTLLHR